MEAKLRLSYDALRLLPHVISLHIHDKKSSQVQIKIRSTFVPHKPGRCTDVHVIHERFWSHLQYTWDNIIWGSWDELNFSIPLLQRRGTHVLNVMFSRWSTKILMTLTQFTENNKNYATQDQLWPCRIPKSRTQLSKSRFTIIRDLSTKVWVLPIKKPCNNLIKSNFKMKAWNKVDSYLWKYIVRVSLTKLVSSRPRDLESCGNISDREINWRKSSQKSRIS